MKPNESEKAVNQSASGSSLSHLIYNPRFRSIAFQLITVAVLGYFFYIIINNTIDNLNSRGISTGFSFLDREAGFGISLALIEYDETYTFGRTFIVGLLNTVLVSFLGIILSNYSWLYCRDCAPIIQLDGQSPCCGIYRNCT